MKAAQSLSLDDRPSFSSFWKNNEDTANKLIFVQSNPSQSNRQSEFQFSFFLIFPPRAQ